MSDPKNNSGSRARKVFNALEGSDEFSVFSVEPEAQKPLVSLQSDTQGRPEDTIVSSSVVRLFRKIFGS